METVLVITHAGGSARHGPNTRWYYLAKALAPFGVNVEIVSSSNFHKYIEPPKVHRRYESEKIDGITYHWIRTRPYSSGGVGHVLNQIEFGVRCWRLRKRMAIRAPNVVIASSPHPLVSFAAVNIARRAKARFFFEVRDLWPEILMQLGGYTSWNPYIVLLRLAEWYGVRSADRIISVKPGDVEYFVERFGVSREAFSYIPNGYLPTDSNKEPPQRIRKLRQQYNFILGYVGAISAYYNLEDMIQVAAKLRGREDIGFVIVGKGNRTPQIARKVHEKGLSNVHLLGAIPKEVVPATIQLFDACYVGLQNLEIHRYGISCNKIYEYMQGGKPIVGSYRARYDPVKEAECGVVRDPGEYDLLARDIEKLANDESLRREYGRRAREYFLTHHDFRVVAKHFVTQVLKGPSGKSESGGL